MKLHPLHSSTVYWNNLQEARWISFKVKWWILWSVTL